MLKNGLQDFKCIVFPACVVEVARIIITDIELEYSTWVRRKIFTFI